jgi:hypothetical protein
LVAVSNDPDIVAEITRRLLAVSRPGSADQAISKLDAGKRAALRVICREAEDARPV